MALTNKNKLFIEEYVANGYKDQAECYQRIYPDASWSTCLTNSSKVLARPEAKQYMRDYQHERFEKLNINADRIAEELAKSAFGEVSEESSYKYSDKLKALDLLQKQLGLQTTKQEIKADKLQISIGVDNAD